MSNNNLPASHAADALEGRPGGRPEKTKRTGALYGLRTPVINAVVPVCRSLISADRGLDPGVSRGSNAGGLLSDRDRMFFCFLGIRQVCA